MTIGFVERLAAARIGGTFNQYAESRLRRERLARYLRDRRRARLLLVGEAPGYRGARVSGIPFTSERQLTGTGPAEATATIVRRTLAELDETIADRLDPHLASRPPAIPQLELATPRLVPLDGRVIEDAGHAVEMARAVAIEVDVHAEVTAGHGRE